MNFKLRLVALLLVVMMLLTSCALPLDQILGYLPEGWIPTTTEQTTTTEPTTTTPTTTPSTTVKTEPEEPKWSKAEHSTSKEELLARYTLTREEVDATIALLDSMIAGADGSMTIEEVDAIYDAFEEDFYHIAQQMTIASIIYYHNMKDEEASTRHLDTQKMFNEVRDKYMESCRTMYLESPYSEELFADWSEEDIKELLDFDPETTRVKEEVEELQVKYNELGEYNWSEKSAEIYAQIVTKNNELAKLYGYENYYDYASVNVYGRDYSKEDLAVFRQNVIKHIVPRFTKLNNGWQALYDFSDTRRKLTISYLTEGFDTMDKNYLLLYLDSLGDTGMGVAMRDVFESKNCAFSTNGNSHPTAFQTYLYEDETPFCFFGSNGQSSSTMVHEFGHYYASYANNDLSNYDLCETHSQGNEFLFLQFCKDELPSKVYSAVRYYNLFNAYYVILMATIIDDFEQRVYALESVEGFTGEDFDAIMTEVIADYGKSADWFETNLANVYDYWRNVAIDNPVYYISYAVSAVAAVEIFAIAEEDYDAAMAAYTTLVEGVTAEDGFLEALKKAGLTTPFETETFEKVAATMRK